MHRLQLRRALSPLLVLLFTAYARGVQADELGYGFRFSFAAGAATASAHESLLNEDGYSGPREGVDVAGWRWLGSSVGLGARVGYRMRSIDGGSSQLSGFPRAPRYDENIVLGGLMLPVRVTDEDAAVSLSFVPELGVGAGKVGFHDGGRFQLGPLFGGSVELYVPGWHAGLLLGVDRIPAGKSGGADGKIDFGMYYAALEMGFDVR